MIEQERFFAGLDFEKQVFLGLTCYKGRDGAYYRVSHFTNSYVIEYAENETQSKIVDQDCTEDDSKNNPYSVLSPDEIDFLFLNGLLK